MKTRRIGTADGKTLPAPSRRRGRPIKESQPRSDRILPAALECFARHGFAGANLRQIAVAANVDVSLIAHRFGSKIGLWEGVVDDLAAAFLRELSGHTSSADSTLEYALEQLVDVVCSRPEVAMFLVKEVARQDMRFDYLYQRLIRPVHDLILPLIEGKAGSAPFDANFFFFTFTGAVAIAVAMRPFISRFSAAAIDDVEFRRALKQTLFSSFL